MSMEWKELIKKAHTQKPQVSQELADHNLEMNGRIVGHFGPIKWWDQGMYRKLLAGVPKYMKEYSKCRSRLMSSWFTEPCRIT